MKLYIFDFDDTLINNFEVDFASFKLLGLNIKRNDLISWRREGFLAREIIEKIGSTNVQEDFQKRKELLESFELWKNASLNKGVLETIKKLDGKAIIISRKENSLVSKILTYFNIREYFSEIYTSKEKGILIKEIIKGLNSTELIFISDDEQDFRQVRDICCKKYCFLAPYKKKEEMSKVAKVINSMEEILQKKVMVLGSTGFIGKYLTKKLVEEGHEVIGVYYSQAGGLSGVKYIKCDISKKDEIEELPRVDVVFNLAACLDQQNEKKCMDVNYNGVINLIDYCKRYNIHLIHSSSTSIYGNPKDLPVSEDYPSNPLTPYAKSKLLAEKEIFFSGINFTILRYGSPYGPGQSVSSVLPFFIEKARAGDPITYLGDGSRIQEFCYVKDIIKGNLFALYNKRGCYHISSGEPVSMKELAQKVVSVFGGRVSSLPKEEYSFSLYLDNKKSREWGFFPDYNLMKGLEDFKNSI